MMDLEGNMSFSLDDQTDAFKAPCIRFITPSWTPLLVHLFLLNIIPQYC